PMGGFLYFLRPGTTKLPLFEGVPLIGGLRRSLLDVALYAALLAAVVRALVAPALTFELLLPVVALVPVLGVLDKTLFLAARAEHYWVVSVVLAAHFALGTGWIAGAKAVQAALWFFAGVSKLNHHFPAVVCVMTSNSPCTPFGWMRRPMYRSYPDDVRPSRRAVLAAHAGTALELGVPMVLLLGDGGLVTTVGMVMMLMLHGFILSTVPMGVPIEWNLLVIYSAFLLFGVHADVSPLAIEPAWLVAFVAGFALVLPVLGNLRPAWVSFLLSMRYYAGNWPMSVWLFEGESYRKLDALTKSSPWLHDQLAPFYDRRTAVGLVGKVMGFRLMHLHGRLLGQVLPRAVENLTRYEWVDGELVAGLALGWNFGDGHLHDEQLLRSLQAQCGWEEGELRVVMVESQPLLRQALRYRIHDAQAGLLEAGEVSVATLRERQPWHWGDAETAAATAHAAPAE
ncbi:MAG: DUF3556 domain-containing protein, partial [Myxococcota bacterium]